MGKPHDTVEQFEACKGRPTCHKARQSAQGDSASVVRVVAHNQSRPRAGLKCYRLEEVCVCVGMSSTGTA